MFTVKMLIPLMAVILILFSVGAGTVIRLFMKNESIIAYGTQFLRGFCLCLPFLCMDFIAVGVFQAVGHGRAALAFAVLRKILLEIPALFILNFLFPLYGLPYAQFVAEFVLSIAAVVMLNHIFKKAGNSNGY